MLNLFDYLSEMDNKRIENYIHKYGASEESYSGNEEYLKYWAKCKPHLFHLLGGQLIYKFPISFKKPEEQLKQDFIKLTHNNKFINRYLDRLDELENFDDNLIIYRRLRRLTYLDTLLADSVLDALKVKPEGYQKTLQLQAGMKPIRAFQKTIDYFGWEDLREDFEKFRIAHSMIFNDKLITGNMCISIHPMDYMTMSDNNSDWTSCMSWKDDGCYHLGTVEMMNSNNVVCCYIESSKDFNFGKEDSDESWHWNNKKWRQLFYITKEIAVCGKAYPYQNKNFSLIILDKIKELSEKNLGKTYTFGPEPYRDMNHIGSNQRMQNNKDWIHYKDTTKHNIIFDTKGMYNDMFNDHDGRKDIYWCYRNKVKHNLVISYSGKAPCICCGGEVLEKDSCGENYEGAYNERYSHTRRVMCRSCRIERRCTVCGDSSGRGKIVEVNGQKLCTTCAESLLKICPSCGDEFVAQLKEHSQLYASLVPIEELYQQTFYSEKVRDPNGKVQPLFMCPKCRDKMRGNFIQIQPPINKQEHYFAWRSKEEYFASKEPIDITLPEWSKFLSKNLKPSETAQKCFLEKD